MSPAIPDRFTVELPHGLLIERLPVGYAHGRWRVSYVLSGAGAVRDRTEGFMGLAHDVEEIVTIEGLGGTLQHRDSSLYGGHAERQLMWTLVGDDGVTGMRITYRYAGEVLATETLTFSE